VHGVAITTADHEPGQLRGGRWPDVGAGREGKRLVKWHSCLTIARYRCDTKEMINDPHIRSSLSRIRVEELIAQADAQRLAREARVPREPRAWRLSALRMLARGLRVEREIDFDVARAPRH
jgi:hypothetical protein